MATIYAEHRGGSILGACVCDDLAVIVREPVVCVWCAQQHGINVDGALRDKRAPVRHDCVIRHFQIYKFHATLTGYADAEACGRTDVRTQANMY